MESNAHGQEEATKPQAKWWLTALDTTQSTANIATLKQP